LQPEWSSPEKPNPSDGLSGPHDSADRYYSPFAGPRWLNVLEETDIERPRAPVLEIVGGVPEIDVIADDITASVRGDPIAISWYVHSSAERYDLRVHRHNPSVDACSSLGDAAPTCAR